MRKPLAWSQGGLGRRPTGHAVRPAVCTAVLTGLFALLNPVPAAAHIAGSSGSPTDYRATVTAVRPAVPTMAVTVGLGGQWVSVVNQGAAEIVVLGDHGEPFLRLAGHRVQVNELSGTADEAGLVPTERAQGERAQGTAATENPSTEPSWVTQREANQATWIDPRLDAPPDSTGASGSWELPLVVDGQRVTVLGTLDRIPPPSPWPWAVVLVLLTAAIAALGWVRNWHRPMAAVVVAGILAFVLHLLGTGLAPQRTGPILGWAGLGSIAVFAVVIGAVTVVSAVRRSRSAADRVVMTGIMVLLLAATDFSVLWHSQLPFAGPAMLDRGLTALTYATALGLLVAGAHLARQTKPDPPASGPASAAGPVSD